MPTRHSILSPSAGRAPSPPQVARAAATTTLAFIVLLAVLVAFAPGAPTGAPFAALGLGAAALIGAGVGRRSVARSAVDPSPPDSTIEDVGAAPASSWDDALLAALSDPLARPVSVVSVVFPRPNTQEHDLDEEYERQLYVMAVRWREMLRPGDHLARLSDDHFALALRCCGTDATPAVLERLRRSAPEASTLVAGVATWNGYESPRQLMLRAAEDRAVQPGSGLAGSLEDPRRVEAARRNGLIERGIRPFDDAATSLAWLLGVELVTISLYDDTTQYLIGEHGAVIAGFPVGGQPAMNSLCRDVVESGRPMVVGDVTRHATLAVLPATEELGVRACAAVPVIDPGGMVIGTVCAIATRHHRWSTDDLTLLRRSAGRVAHQIGERRASAR